MPTCYYKLYCAKKCDIKKHKANVPSPCGEHSGHDIYLLFTPRIHRSQLSSETNCKHFIVRAFLLFNDYASAVGTVQMSYYSYGKSRCQLCAENMALRDEHTALQLVLSIHRITRVTTLKRQVNYKTVTDGRTDTNLMHRCFLQYANSISNKQYRYPSVLVCLANMIFIVSLITRGRAKPNISPPGCATSCLHPATPMH